MPGNAPRQDPPPSFFKKYDTDDLLAAIDFWKIIRGIKRHIFLIFICIVGFFGIGLYYSFQMKTTYKAEVILLQNHFEKGGEGAYIAAPLSLATLVEIIKLPKHYERVKTLLGLDLSPGEIAGMVELPMLGRNPSNFFRFTVKGDNPNLAIDVANAVAKEALRASQEFIRQQLKIALNAYRAHAAVIQQTLHTRNQEIEKFKLSQKYFGMDAELSSILAKVEGARDSYENAKVEYDRQVVHYENLKREIESLPEKVPIDNSRADNPLKTRILNLEIQLAVAKAKYTSDNPKVRQIEIELNELIRASNKELDEGSQDTQLLEKNQVRQGLENELLHLGIQMRTQQKLKEESKKQYEEEEGRLAGLPSLQMEFSKLLQEKNLTEEQFISMARTIKQIELMIMDPKGIIDIYQFASVARPSSSGSMIILLPILAGVFGLVVGLFLSMFLEVMDSKFRTLKQIENTFTIPCFVTIPQFPKLLKKNAERRTLYFIKCIVEQIDQYFSGEIPKGAMISVASALRGEGKSLLTQNLGRFFASRDKKVLFLGLDPQKNSLVDAMPENPNPLKKILSGEESIDNVSMMQNISRISLDESDEDLMMLMKSLAMNEFLKKAKEKFDLIIVDTPSVVDNDTVYYPMKLSDFRVFVIGSPVANKSIVCEAISVFEKFKVELNGIVLNLVDPIYIDSTRVKRELKKNRK